MSGIDLTDMSSIQPEPNMDIARSVKKIAKSVKWMQDQFTELEKVTSWLRLEAFQSLSSVPQASDCCCPQCLRWRRRGSHSGR